MDRVLVKGQVADGRDMGHGLHSQDAERHEQAAKHHKLAAECENSGDEKGAEVHARTARGHAVHTTMHWIDPASLPEASGTLTKFLYNVQGEVEGFLLDGQRQVHFPPHMTAELLKAVKVGEKVTVHGVKPRDVDLLVGVSVTAANGTLIVDHETRSKS